MNRILERVAYFLMSSETQKYELCEIQVEFIEDKPIILEHINRCRRSGGILGIYSSELGDGMFLTTPDAVYELGPDTIIDLKVYHFRKGYTETATVSLKDIKCICPFNQILQ